MTIILTQVATVPFSLLLREVMLKLPMAPEFEVEYRMKEAVREFCQRSLSWRQPDTELLVTVVGQRSYTADLPGGTEIAAVISAWNGSTELDVELPGEQDDFEPSSTDSEWKVGMEPTMDAFRLSPAPLTAGITITGTLALAPNDDATEAPAYVWNRWRKVVAAGCIAAMKEQTDKPWSDPAGAMHHQQRFEAGIREASDKAGPVRRRPLRVRAW
jgi:hypothetical protein